MFELSKIQSDTKALQNNLGKMKHQNKIGGVDLGDYIFNKLITKMDPIEYCHRVLRDHLPPSRQKLHENQIELIRAVCNPKVRSVAALMARQAGKTESIASFTGYLLDNYPNMRIGIFTPRIQQAEVNVGRTAVFFQMNEEKLNNKLIKCTKQRIELSNGSFVMAVSGSDQSNIEGLTFDIIVLDEAQKISNYTVSERIVPMGGATNAKLIKIGTPKFRNHFWDSFQPGAAYDPVTNPKGFIQIRRDWTQCPQLWALGKTMLPDYEDPSKDRPYSTYVLGLMPKSLKQDMFPKNPEVWTEGEMSVEDFKTQYMLEFVDGAGQFITTEEWNTMTGIEREMEDDFDWIEQGKMGEKYVAGIDFAGSSSDGGDFTHISVLRVLPNGKRQKVFGMDMRGLDYNVQRMEIVKLFGGPKPRFSVSSIFADYTGCGRPIIDILKHQDGLTMLEGIIFNASDTYTRSGMNMKNIMFAKIKNEINVGRFVYPSKDRINASENKDLVGFYHKMIGEWKDLEMETRATVNKIIQAPSGGHDDTCCSDALANFAAEFGSRGRMPRPTIGRMRR
ncbi:gp1 [Bacillus phage G]|uniref:Gp1 n=1 Tax=Bacillus phage G TaxID=2884420 RepID=G3MBJ7_9CAUD|nr:gp1 [Bacillus phage G]AEO93272.1 gp1 [Bacillus phage G]